MFVLRIFTDPGKCLLVWAASWATETDVMAWSHPKMRNQIGTQRNTLIRNPDEAYINASLPLSLLLVAHWNMRG